jgi:hypothetical protein
VPKVAARVVEDAFGIAALVLVAIFARLRDKRRRVPAS